MNYAYHVLLVEDESYDAELNIREIKKVLPESKFKIVDNKKDYLYELEEFRPSIIISDYNMPAFDGLSALKIAQQVCPLTPFIMVTGSINEDTAVECMKAGAIDYVLKDSLKRLGSSVLNALEQQRIRKERTEAFETIKINEAKYRYMFHNNPQPMWIVDIETLAFLEVNEAAVNHYGYTPKEFLQMTLNDICQVNPTEDVQFVGDIPNRKEISIHKKKIGELIYVEVVSHPIIFNSRNAKHVLINDITDRKKTEEKLIQERKLLRTLIDNLPVTIYVKDAKCRKIIANLADLDIIGADSEKEVIGKTDLEIFGEEVGARGYSDDKQVIESGEPILNREEDFTDKTGELRWLVTSKIPLTDENGESIGLVGIGRDITEQRKAQEKILKLSKGIEQSPATIMITDLNGIIEYVNPKFFETTGFTEAEAIGKTPRILKSGLTPQEVYHDLWDTITAGKIWSGELQNMRKDGTLYWETATITGIKNEKGTITNFIAINEDISERKIMQAELIKAKERAEESDRLKSAFLANMSHEIRTPLNSIIGFSELLGDPDFDEEQKNEFINAIVENGNSLLLIISDIMDFSMLEAQQVKIRKETIPMKKLFKDLLTDFGNKAVQKGLDFRIDQKYLNSDIILESDLYRIRQVFNNLISNSIKFTEKGHIEIGFEIKDDLMTFHVKDTGIGISPEYHEAIFERFRQVDTTRTRRYGGNGLGLAISKNLVKLLGGSIWVESEPGKFSNFFFTIPLNA